LEGNSAARRSETSAHLSYCIQLKDTFEKRLSPPKILPSQFDEAQHAINQILSGLLPETTEDQTPEGFFSRRWKEGDIGRLKDHLRKHSLDSSSGEDQTTYADLLAVPNEDLAPLYNECTARGDAPSIFFMTLLIGILKRLKPQDNPDNYRIVALESCFLKCLTILVHWAILDWAEAQALIPRFQNGFCPGYRINNNPFILHCLNEWTKASGFKLYVAVISPTLSHPQINQPYG
jgi:hypothetical protein